MENLHNKEQRLENALEKLKNLSNSFSGGQNDVDSLNIKKINYKAKKMKLRESMNNF